MVVDGIAGRLRREFRPGKGDYLYASATHAERDVLLVKPLTFMNNSGTAVMDVLDRSGRTIEDLLVVTDDMALPLGRIRLRARGSDGGHNGLYSIIYQLNSDAFPRLRCGIRKELMPAKDEMRSFVLSPFDPDEKKIVCGMVQQAGEAIFEMIGGGIARSMTRFNT